MYVGKKVKVVKYPYHQNNAVKVGMSGVVVRAYDPDHVSYPVLVHIEETVPEDNGFNMEGYLFKPEELRYLNNRPVKL